MDIGRTVKELLIRQCRKPAGLLGEYVARRMNRSHLGLTTWGLSHVDVGANDFLLDIGCGGGRTVARLAAMAPEGLVCGIDVSAKSVAISRRASLRAIWEGRVAIRQASVSRLPFPDDTFRLATAVETHYFWPDMASDLREVLRVLRPGGRLLLIAEVYHCEKFDARNREWLALTPMTYLGMDEFRSLFAAAGFTDIVMDEEPDQGWLCCVGRKPLPPGPPAAAD
ncbi:Methyltransferase type 11 [Solidesulfovibrio carbinoliphilus subsp. oakridgensis]|uniref:Methyltransferase type 11 n=1 Tax=Solidesulfovibrio carbinoliphilus subsp. oakridgensis TaxID=694327 RepID=G7QDG1_9BACT|nr:class I SAM-dependent methyltransferase [Solidesulfovibrio carbinoliphilus]EHJ46467.1 Methyltransferase type 11 [Solidesulfovibrio carbinoliphilus subsp. oakridgensis]